MNLDHPTLYWTFVFVFVECCLAFVEGCFVCVLIFVFVFVFVEYVFTLDRLNDSAKPIVKAALWEEYNHEISKSRERYVYKSQNVQNS